MATRKASPFPVAGNTDTITPRIYLAGCVLSGLSSLRGSVSLGTHKDIAELCLSLADAVIDQDNAVEAGDDDE